MAALGDVWGQLSPSSRKALRWARAAARYRAEQEGEPVNSVPLNEFDLLVGILMSHPTDSEPRALLEHVGATAVDLLPRTYVLAPPDVLEQHVQYVPDEMPYASPAVDQALQEAADRQANVGGTVHLAMVFGALWYGRNELATAIRDLLGRVGLSAAADTYQRYLDQRGQSYADFLKQHHPFNAAPIEIPSYKPDHGPGSMGDDYVDIRAEVDAFAYLLSSRALQPPLAVGLFGHWGSGKTYFMDAVRSRIEQVVRSEAVSSRPQSEVPFWKSVVQVEFNAWHYVEGDLWASLVEHVFSQLKVHDEEDETEVAKRQKHWLGRLDEKLRARGDLTLAKEEKEHALDTAKDKLRQAEETRDTKLDELAEAEKKATGDIVLSNSIDQVTAAVTGLVDADLKGSATEALAALDAAKAELERARGLLHELPRESVVVLAAVPIVVGLLQWWGADGGTQAIAGITGLLGVVTGTLRSATNQVRTRLDKIEQAKAQARKEFDAQRQAAEAEVTTARQQVAAAKAEVDQLSEKEKLIELEIAQLDERVAGVTSGALLSEFVSERVTSTDYRARLGTAALVQRDFRALSKLIEERNETYLDTDQGGAPGHDVLNRIILYIDDLDRCEPTRVVKVLQAVHLLLAFPLFVVVVAVDSRWLSESLQKHYPALGSRSDDRKATPSDYLEKIFQVPFWIDPLSADVREGMVHGLLQRNVVGTSYGDTPPSDDPLVLNDQQRKLFDSLFSHRTAIHMQTAVLGITANELRFLDELGPLLGTTPRSIKRFVNVYQLLCALPEPPAEAGAPPYSEMVAFLLAITEGLPDLMTSLRQHLDEKVDFETLNGSITFLRPMLPEDEMARYDEWATKNPMWSDFPIKHLRAPADRVRRFSFR